MKTKILSVILSAIILSTSAATLTGCGGEKESVAKIATSDEAATKIETVTEVATDEQGSTQIVEETKVIEDTTTNLKSESYESSETKANDSLASTNSSTGNNSSSKSNSNSASTSKNNNSVSSKTNSNSTSVKKTSSKKSSSSSSTKKSNSKTVAVSSVSLSKSSMSVTVGKSSSFTVTINPSNATNRDYTASTSNGNATVNCSGSTVTVKGISKGSCTVTVKSNNGKTAKCSVTVKAKSKPKSTKVTDDTPLSRNKFLTDKNIQKTCNEANKYFKSKGMRYDSSKNKNNSGWFFAPTSDYSSTAKRSVNQLIQETIEYFDAEVQANLMDEPGDRYEDIKFNCYYERLNNGEYEIYFCYG